MNLRRRFGFLTAACTFLIAAFPLHPLCGILEAAEPILPSDLLQIQRVTDVRLATDSSFAVYGVQSVHTEPAKDSGDPVYSYRTHLWLVDFNQAGGAAPPLQLTFGDRNDSDFEISPDGKSLAFVRVDKTQPKPKPQVWLLPLHGPGEARELTHLEFGATSPHWRPDGKALLVTSSVPLSKLPGKPPFEMGRPQRDWPQHDSTEQPEQSSVKKPPLTPDADLAGIRRWLDYNASKQNPTDITRMAFLDESTLTGEMEVAELFRIDLPGEATEPKATQLTRSFYPHRGATYSPDGRTILFTSRPPSSKHPDFEREKSAIWSLDPESFAEKPLISDEHYSFASPEFTPDGRHIILTGAQNDQPTYRQAMLGQTDPDGTHLTWLTRDGDSAVQQFRLTDTGDVYFDQSFHGGVRLQKLNLNSRKTDVVIDGPVGVSAMDASAKRIVYALISVADPNELYVRDASGAASVQLTALNSGWLKGKELSLPEEHWITRPDGQKVQYWVMKPTHPAPGKKYPWVLDMHGGPSAMWGPGELSMWHEFQLFCSFGYGVVYANPRGSSGYGYEFQRANYKDWGDGPQGDVLAALDDAVAHNPSIDKDRLFLTGGSYAGYLTAWIIGHDQRFKAAAAQRGVYDLSTFFGEGNAYVLVPEEFGGYPWQPEVKRLLDQQSPITYVADIHTPFLIIHGSNDLRTGFVQSQMLFRALRQMGRPVEYIRYPGATHELTRSGEPRQRLDHMLRIIEFFERYSQNDRAAPQSDAPAKPTSAETPTAGGQ